MQHSSIGDQRPRSGGTHGSAQRRWSGGSGRPRCGVVGGLPARVDRRLWARGERLLARPGRAARCRQRAGVERRQVGLLAHARELSSR